MEEMKDKYKDLHRLFVAYLHQDWTVEGSSLSEVFVNNEGLQSRAPGIYEDVESLLKENRDNDDLDRLFVRKWHTGYEPEEDEGENWTDVLQEIARICLTYTTAS